MFANTYIHFDHNIYKKTFIRDKMESENKITRILSANHGTAPTFNHIVESHGLFYVIDVAWLNSATGV